MPITQDVHALQQERYRILGEIASLGDLPRRPASRQADPSLLPLRQADLRLPARGRSAGHGPYYVLRCESEGRPTTRSIRAGQAEATQAQVAEYERLRRLHRELIAVSERLCEARLEQERRGAGAREAGKKRELLIPI